MKTGFAVLLTSMAVAGVVWLVAGASLFAFVSGFSVAVISLSGALLLLRDVKGDAAIPVDRHPDAMEGKKSESVDSRLSGIWRTTGERKRESRDSD